MLFSQDVINALFGRVGFKNNPAQAKYAVNVDNQESRSGRYFKDFHPLATQKVYADTMEFDNYSNDFLNEELTSLQKSAISAVLNNVFNVEDLLEQFELYQLSDNAMTELENTDQFVGFRFKIANDISKAVRINSVSLLFNQDVTFKLYCYNRDKRTKVWEKEVTVMAYELTQVQIDDLVLRAVDNTANGLIYDFGYYQTDLGTAKALNDNSVCLNNGFLWRAQSFQADLASISNNPDDFYKDYVSRYAVTYNSNSYGLNLEVGGYNDYSNVIVKNQPLFDEAIGYQVAQLILSQAMYSTRSNGTERLTNERIKMASDDLNISGPTDQVPLNPGIKSKLSAAIRQLRKNFLSKPLLQKTTASFNDSCQTKTGRYGQTYPGGSTISIR